MELDATEQKEMRRARIIQLKAQGKSLKDVARIVFAEGLTPSDTERGAYALVRKDMQLMGKALLAQAQTASPEVAAVWRTIYIEQVETLYRVTLGLLANESTPITEKVRLIGQALKAAENLAQVNGVQTKAPVAVDLTVKEDPAEAHARALIARSKQLPAKSGAKTVEVVSVKKIGALNPA